MRLKKLILHGFKSFADRTEFVFDCPDHRHRRPQRLRQEQRRRRVQVGARRAVRQEPARRRDAGRDLQRLRRRASPAAWPKSSWSSKTPSARTARASSTSTPTRWRSAGGSSATAPANTTSTTRMSRLKDIREMFLDTGVGVDAYSVIEQGRVDLLLRSQPGGTPPDLRRGGRHLASSSSEEGGAAASWKRSTRTCCA